MKFRSILALSVVSMLLLAACDSAKKAGAEAAIKTAETAFSAVSGESSKYVPDQTKAVQDSLTAARTSLTNGDYEAALNSAKDLPGKISDLAAAVKAKKDELTAQWTSLSAELPKNLSEIQAKAAALTKTHKLPAGAGDKLVAVQQMWTDASGAFTGGNLADAIAKANQVKDSLGALRTTLGMKPAA